MRRGPAPRPALLVPDEVSLTLWGHDPGAAGLTPVAAPGAARTILVADPVPAGLVDPLRGLREQLADGVSFEVAPTGLAGEPARAVLWEEPAGQDGGGHAGDPHKEADHGRHDHGDHGDGGHGDGGHGEHEDHGDMMAIEGDPSADGLVMEPIEWHHGPLATGLAGGLVLAVGLDGDVVSTCTIHPTLHAGRGPLPDPLASAAWRSVIAAATSATGPGPSERWRAVAEVELERALSHVAWLRSLVRLLGWSAAIHACDRAVTAALELRGRPDDDSRLEEARRALDRLVGLLADNRALRARTRGRGEIEPTAELMGPPARACGQARDLRIADPFYGELGFEAVTEDGGDALARTLVRLREAAQSLELAASSLERAGKIHAGNGEAPGRPAAVEGPRGPLTAARAGGELRLGDLGAAASLAAAGQAAVGHEWASALVVVASFDLSPWRVEP